MRGASWVLISFLLNTDNEDLRRTLFESFMVLSPQATAAENSRSVADRAVLWTDVAALYDDLRTYVGSRKTFSELIQSGRDAYAAHDAGKATAYFLSALALEPSHYAAPYYLGLLAYESQNYDLAENYYRSALQYGADEALVSYALALNAAAAGRNSEALSYLDRAEKLSPDRYKAKAEDLRSRLKAK
jgi:tetratricopeptide (TPR) repeat protein